MDRKLAAMSESLRTIHGLGFLFFFVAKWTDHVEQASSNFRAWNLVYTETVNMRIKLYNQIIMPKCTDAVPYA